jgi:tetratricopeptide (TPR) repeat protein
MDLEKIKEYKIKYYKFFKKYEKLIDYLEKIENKSENEINLLAFSLIQIGRFEKALSYWEGNYANNPDDKYLNTVLGNEYWLLGYSNKAIPFLEKSLQVANLKDSNEHKSKTHWMLGDCYRNIYDFDKAELHYDLAINLIPLNLDAVYGKGELMRLSNRFDEITPFFESIVNKYPDFYPGYLLLIGQYIHYLQNFSLAIPLCEKAFILANDSLVMKKYQNSLDHCCIFKDVPFTYLITLLHAGEKEEALEKINFAYKIGNSTYYEYIRNKIEYYSFFSDWNSTYHEYEKLFMQRKYQSFGLMAEMILCKDKIAHSQENIDDIYAEYCLYKPWQNSYYFYGEILYQNEKYSQAKDIFLDLITRFPCNDEFRYYYSTCLMEIGNYNEASNQFAKLMIYNPIEGSYQLGLGVCLYEMGEKEKSISIIQDAFRSKKFINPEDPIFQRSNEILT